MISTVIVQAQESVNSQTIAQLYQLLQARDQGPNDVAELTSGIDWKETGEVIKVDPRYTISFPAVMQNRWDGLEFRDLDFQEVTKDEIRVTGTVSGRQHTECEFITSKFSHSWSLRDGKIVQFLEEF